MKPSKVRRDEKESEACVAAKTTEDCRKQDVRGR